MHVKIRGQLEEVGLLSCYLVDSGECQLWWQEPLPAKQSLLFKQRFATLRIQEGSKQFVPQSRQVQPGSVIL